MIVVVPCSRANVQDASCPADELVLPPKKFGRIRKNVVKEPVIQIDKNANSKLSFVTNGPVRKVKYAGRSTQSSIYH